MAEDEHPNLSAIFDKNFKLYEDVEDSVKPTNSDEVQGQIKESIKGLVKTTVMVSELSVFSGNESAEELPTSSLKFLLLPVLLGSLTLKRTDIDRSQALRLAEVYFRDFVRRCRQYELTKVELPRGEEEDEEEEEEEEEEEKEKKGGRRKATPPVKKGMPTPEELQAMARQREDKIKRFREKKALGDRLVALRKALESPSHDEDTLRHYHLTRLEKFICLSVEEVESIVMERRMLAEMARMRVDGTLPPPADLRTSHTPLKPILLARDTQQKNVFGLGYPGLPSLTVEEFYDQRVRDGWFPDPNARKNCLQDRAKLGQDTEKEVEEREEEEKEREEEEEDPERLARDRERDEWRDDHRRGWGNTYNRS